MDQKLDHFKKRITPAYYDVGRHSVYQNVQLFNRSSILNGAIFKYSLHMFRETILHEKYQLT